MSVYMYMYYVEQLENIFIIFLSKLRLLIYSVETQFEAKHLAYLFGDVCTCFKKDWASDY